MHVLHIVGARPNLMKLAPVYRAFARIDRLKQTIVHTGQHYDFNMSDVFFQQLKVPPPDINLQVGSASHAKQTAGIMVGLEEELSKLRPDLVVVYGDVNSTLAAALVCSKLQILFAHVEAGLRSFDHSMPEEINRLVTDRLADFLFTPSVDGDENLAAEGVPPNKVFLVGNVMIDTLVQMLPSSDSQLPENLPPHFALMTLHRASNVDDSGWLKHMLESLNQLGARLPILFPVHPRTSERIAGFSNVSASAIKLMAPQPYLTFLALQKRATVVITDSGGIQEETTFLGVPCITVRENTERPITVALGTNILVGRDSQRICEEFERVISGQIKVGHIPPLWDGCAAERIAEILRHMI